MHPPNFLFVRTGFRCVAQLLAILAVFAVTVGLRAQEYEVDGTIELKLNHPDKSPWKDFQGRFRVYVNGCAWLIQVTEMNDYGIPQRREVGTADGKEVFEMVVPYEPLSPSDPVLVGVTNMQIAPSGLVTSSAIPVGNQDSSFTGNLWLMFASGCYFRTAAPGQLTPAFDWRATPYMNNHMTMKASWELINGPGSLPSRVTYFEPDGAISAVYTATDFTNAGAIRLPEGFNFSQPGTGYKEVTAVVTAVRPTCSRADLRPAIKQKLTMIDVRWHPDDLGGGFGGGFPAYGADYWPNVKQAQEIYYSTRGGAPKKTLATNSVSLMTNRAEIMAKMQGAMWKNGDTPFASAIVDHPGVKLPEQGPWTISSADLKQQIGLIIDLVEHNKRLAQDHDPMFLFLWNSLTSETRSALEEERAKMGIPGVYYKPGQGLQVLVTNLNQLIQGKLIYDEKTFAPVKPYLSGDTVKLLNQPAGADVARLNRLLLEDVFPLDIMRRPKILFEPDSKNFVFVDFTATNVFEHAESVSLYGQDGKKKWTADLGPSIEDEARHFPYFRNPGIPANYRNVGLWDVYPQPGVLMFQAFGKHIYGIDLNTGTVIALPHT